MTGEGPGSKHQFTDFFENMPSPGRIKKRWKKEVEKRKRMKQKECKKRRLTWLAVDWPAQQQKVATEINSYDHGRRPKTIYETYLIIISWSYYCTVGGVQLDQMFVPVGPWSQAGYSSIQSWNLLLQSHHTPAPVPLDLLPSFFYTC